ncbi:MAG: transposase [Nitrosomonas sp.]|nr:transposase [Nitrosomonas sp.]
METNRTLLSGKPSDCGNRRNNRLFPVAVLWVCCTGAPWRDLARSLGVVTVCNTRYNRWSKRAVGKRYSRPYQRPATLNI